MAMYVLAGVLFVGGLLMFAPDILKLFQGFKLPTLPVPSVPTPAPVDVPQPVSPTPLENRSLVPAPTDEVDMANLQSQAFRYLQWLAKYYETFGPPEGREAIAVASRVLLDKPQPPHN